MTLEVLFVQDIDKLNERHYLKEKKSGYICTFYKENNMYKYVIVCAMLR